MIEVTPSISLPLSEVDLSAIRAQGAGGQNVNKVSSAIHLRFDIGASSLPQYHKHRLRQLYKNQINSDDVLIIKAQTKRTQEANKAEALERLAELIRKADYRAPVRRATKPTKASQRRRVEGKKKDGQKKQFRQKPGDF